VHSTSMNHLRIGLAGPQVSLLTSQHLSRQPEGCCLFEMRFHAALKSSFPRRVERQGFAC